MSHRFFRCVNVSSNAVVLYIHTYIDIQNIQLLKIHNMGQFVNIYNCMFLENVNQLVVYISFKKF